MNSSCLVVVCVVDQPSKVDDWTPLLEGERVELKFEIVSETTLDVLEAQVPDCIVVDIGVESGTLCERIGNLALDPRPFVILCDGNTERLATPHADYRIGGIDDRRVHAANLRSLLDLLLIRLDHHLGKAVAEDNRDFLSVLMHGIRAPLNAMLGWAQVLRTGVDDASLVHRAAEAIERNALEQKRIIIDIADHAKIIRNDFKLETLPSRVGSVVELTCRDLQRGAEAKKVALDAAIATDTELEIDRERLGQALKQIVSNAVKFMPGGGHVTVSVERTPESVKIVVSDTGIGMDEETLRLFDTRPRRRSSEKHEIPRRRGIGIVLARTIVEHHGGVLRATSSGHDRGSTVWIELPLRPHERDCSDGATVRLDGVTVLVVDDESDARDLLDIILNGLGASVVTCSTPAEAYSMLADTTSKIRPDVLVSDVSMPGEDGYSLVQRVRRLSCDSGGTIPAIAVTAFSQAKDREEALRAGFHSHLSKPVDGQLLARTIASLLRGTAC